MFHTVCNQGNFIFVYKYEKGTPVRLFVAALGISLTYAFIILLYDKFCKRKRLLTFLLWHFLPNRKIVSK